MEEEYPNRLTQLSRVSDRITEQAGWKPKDKSPRIVKWLFNKAVKRGYLKAMISETIEISYVEGLQEKVILDAIMNAAQEARIDLFRDEPIVVIGQSELLDLEKAVYDFGYNAGPFGQMHRNGDREYFGVRVRVVPWIKGWAVLPKAALES